MSSDEGRRARGESRERSESRGYNLLAEVARAALEEREAQPLLERVSKLVAEALDWDLVAFLKPVRSRKRVLLEAIVSRLAVELRPGAERSIPAPIGLALLSRKPQLVHDVERDPKASPLAPGVSCVCCVPVMDGSEVVSLLVLEDRLPHEAENVLPLLEALARLLGGPLRRSGVREVTTHRAESVELLGELSRAVVESERLDVVLRRIADRLRDRFGFLVTAVHFVDFVEGRLELKALSLRGAPKRSAAGSGGTATGVVRRAVRLRETQLVHDVSADPESRPLFEETRAELAIPIIFRRRLLGVFGFENDDPAAFGRESVALLETVTDQLAGLMNLVAANRHLEATRAELERANQKFQEMNRRLEETSTVDALTGVANRRQFDEVLDVEWRRAKRTSIPLSLLMIDVDFFKRYNDVSGHQRGDEVLVKVARELAAAFHRAGDLVARYGGEEFVVLLPYTTHDAAIEVAEHARSRIEALKIAHPASEVSRVVTVSIGAASMQPDPRQSADLLVGRGDRALYRAKAGGRNCVRGVQ